MKTRIRINHQADGSKKYIAEVKPSFFQRLQDCFNQNPLGTIFMFPIVILVVISFHFDWDEIDSILSTERGSEEDCMVYVKNAIDEKLLVYKTKQDEKLKQKLRNKTVKTEYIDYP